MLEVGWDEVRARRLERSSLGVRAGADRLVDVADALCGVHAQVQASAELQLAARLDGAVQTDVRVALWERRTLIKAWTVRGTLHLHPAEKLRSGLRPGEPCSARGTAACRRGVTRQAEFIRHSTPTTSKRFARPWEMCWTVAACSATNSQ